MGDLCGPGWAAPTERALRACSLLEKTGDVPTPGLILGYIGFGLIFAFCATLMIGREPRNAVGWSLTLIGAGMVAGGAATAWSVHTLIVDPGSLPAGALAGWMSSWSVNGSAIFAPFAFFFLYFPTGRPPSPRWRIVAWAAGAAGVTQVFLAMFSPRALLTDPTRGNPLAIPSLQPAVELLDIASFLLLIVSILAAVVSLGFRFRRARGLERQQLKWMVAAGGFFAFVMLMSPIFFTIPALYGLWQIVLPIALALIPISAAIAVMKYRLYEIDLIVNRTVVYVVLTLVLAAVYMSVVSIASTTIGESDVAVAGATLLIAALFDPLRRRIQGRVDHLFYRRRYDAGQTLDLFRTRLRQQIDLESVSEEMIEAVQSTMQPVHVSVWLLPPRRAGGS